ncbi:conjugative transposon protein TraM [Bacteroides thetaiotaomicron]|uniref:conjugative transposon protein TraM n=1 Tax=Bacteroides thetaiotaomicron TaxID=818 RepID=UPI0040639BED
MTQSDKKEEKDKETQKAGSASEKEKKLNRKVADKLKFYGVVTFLSLLCAGFIWFIFKPDASETVEGTAGINTTIPDAIAPETMADKQKAYELEEMKKRRQEKVRTLQDVAGGYLMPDTTDGLKPEEDVPKADAIRESREKQRQISRQITSFYQEPKESPRVDELERQVKELNEKLERERKGQDPLELMEKSYEMAARYFPGQTGGQVKNIQPAGGASGNPAAIAAGRATENVVSSLAVPPAPDTIPRNYGFATAVGGGQLAGANTIRACVAEDQTVATGSRIKFRLLEPLQVGGVLVPTNTPLFGTVRIEGQRMAVSVNSIESGGNILPVELEAYDMDGQAGLFVPNTAERTAMKEAAANIGSGFGTSISFARSASQQLVMDVTRGVLSGGSQYLATKMREVKVSVKANYQLLLISKKQ